MKRLFQSYISFTRTERMGLIGLLALLVVLITIRLTMHLWVQPPRSSEKERQLLAAWQDMQKQNVVMQEVEPAAVITTAEVANDQRTPSPAAQLFPFDPNTIDSAGLRKLGLREKTTSNLLHWRAKGKRFYKKEDLKPLYTLTDDEYNRLAPYITIKIQKINLNTADSLQLIALRGIGPKLAHRILQRRRDQGNFTSYDQLRELYAFPDSTFSMLKQQLLIK